MTYISLLHHHGLPPPYLPSYIHLEVQMTYLLSYKQRITINHPPCCSTLDPSTHLASNNRDNATTSAQTGPLPSPPLSALLFTSTIHHQSQLSKSIRPFHLKKKETPHNSKDPQSLSLLAPYPMHPFLSRFTIIQLEKLALKMHVSWAYATATAAAACHTSLSRTLA